jgi:hypothetical protein
MDHPRTRRNSYLPWKRGRDDGACLSSGRRNSESLARPGRTPRLPWLAIAAAAIVLASSINEPTLSIAALVVGLALLAANVLH